MPNRQQRLSTLPLLVYADEDGAIHEDPHLTLCGRTGWDATIIESQSLIPLPEGSDLYVLPQRYPIGWNRHGSFQVCKKGFAVAAHLAPAHTQFYLAAYVRQQGAPTLPLFAYTAVGWFEGRFWVPAIRIDKDKRQEPSGFDQKKIEAGVRRLVKRFPKNRLLAHHGFNCALTYCCPAARNLFLGRFEAPIAVAAACNSNCLGCISYQPPQETIQPSQPRITFRPTVSEIVEYAVAHLENAPNGIVSFGQGCEGEPLLQWQLIRDAIRQIRKHTQRGTIHMNTNGSMPQAVEALCQAGLDSIRVSLNSVRKELYEKYYLPSNYAFEDVQESLCRAQRLGKWTSINYFVFPGVTDEPEEYVALQNFLTATKLNMIQWRNFNIDPDWYLEKLGWHSSQQPLGMRNVIRWIKKKFPQVRHGYFNPPIGRFLRTDVTARKGKKLLPTHE